MGKESIIIEVLCYINSDITESDLGKNFISLHKVMINSVPVSVGAIWLLIRILFQRLLEFCLMKK